MIHYQVRCGQGHEFDGWFKDSAAFDRQAKRGLVECPVCGDVKAARALMTPAVSKKQSAAVAPPAEPAVVPAAPAAAQVAAAGGRVPDQVRAMLQRLRAEVEKSCDYVGPEFAKEARKIHRGESEKRGIYGETTPEQAEALSEEGIEVSAIPWVPRADG
jgi:hypothetical protein